MKRRAFLAASLPVLLSACGADNIWASDEALRQARFISDEPPSITLFTVIGIPRGQGGHSGLMINGSQRVIYDPAGSWHHPRIPERHDVLYGITDNFKHYYIDYHARVTWWVAADTVRVSREVADIAIRRAEQNGASSKNFCAVETGTVLKGVPGFEGAPTGFSPTKLRDWFLTLPGVTSQQFRDGDPANNHDVLIRQKDGILTGYPRA
ncbi:hypothetical protein [Paracoccus sp. (in: a-proteobacteria)]|uniref:hypothetical protein n=1 Tax=Paracoccus sp. TaxID=267 RepID=UPI003A83E287